MRSSAKCLVCVVVTSCLSATLALCAQELSSKDKNLLQAIAKRESEKALRLLRTGGASANITDSTGRTALMNAVISGLTEVVKELVGRGADINAKSKEGQTALMLAADFGDVESVRLLLAKGADWKAKDQDEWTALEYAKMRLDGSPEEKKKNYEEIVRILQEAAKPPVAQARGSR